MGGDEVRQHRQVELRLRRLHTELHPRDRAGHVLADILEHALEQGEGFLLIFVDRRLLRIGAQMHHLAQRVER